VDNDCYIFGTSGFSSEVTQYIENNKLSDQNALNIKGYFDNDGNVVNKSEFVGLGADGSLIERHPSTLGLAEPSNAIAY
jgi:hypothetical protein